MRAELRPFRHHGLAKPARPAASPHPATAAASCACQWSRRRRAIRGSRRTPPLAMPPPRAPCAAAWPRRRPVRRPPAAACRAAARRVVARNRDAHQRGGIEQRARAEAHRQLREVGVARLHDRVVHGDRSVRMLIQVVVADHARAGDACAHAALILPRQMTSCRSSSPIEAQRRGGGHQLERRAGRIEPVAARGRTASGVLIVAVVARRLAAASGQRITDRREQVAGVRIDHDGRGPAGRRARGVFRRGCGDARPGTARRSSA